MQLHDVAYHLILQHCQSDRNMVDPVAQKCVDEHDKHPDWHQPLCKAQLKLVKPA
jgi:hypothetical protein